VFIDMILTPETVLELDRTLKVSEEVLRHLIKRRDPKTVQKEREARAAAAAAAVAPAAPRAEAEQPAQPEANAIPVDDAEVVSEEAALPVELAVEDIADVPPAIEESIEA
ncbi:MAG: hypothetical protein ABI396_04635, partial [Ktedonobacteraceae bacterium]